MSSEEYYIAACCIVRNNCIIKDGEVIYDKKVATAADFLKDAYETLQADYPKFYKMDTLSKLGIVAVAALCKDSFDNNKYLPHQKGIVLSNHNASIEADINYFEGSKNYPSPALFVYTLPNIVIGELSIRYAFKGENAFFISEHFDAEWIHFYVTDLLAHERLQTCICGWLDVKNEELDGCLFLIEKTIGRYNTEFSVNNLNNIYNTQYGK